MKNDLLEKLRTVGKDNMELYYNSWAWDNWSFFVMAGCPTLMPGNRRGFFCFPWQVEAV